MSEIIEQLRREGKNRPPSPVLRPVTLARFGNPPGTYVLRIIDGKLFEDEPIAWELRSEGQPIPVLLGMGAVEGDFAVATKKDTAIGRRYFTVIHGGKYFDNFTQWLYAQCAEHDPNFSPRWASSQSR